MVSACEEKNTPYGSVNNSTEMLKWLPKICILSSNESFETFSLLRYSRSVFNHGNVPCD